MTRRIHVSAIHPGELLLEPSQAHHLRDVLRLKLGSSVELFDNTGNVGSAVITRLDAQAVEVRVDEIVARHASGGLTVASAIPKGDRADWMIEKLSELGVDRFIPLQTARSVVHPTGAGKRDRWSRIATESAKQSRRVGVMQIDELIGLEVLLRDTGLLPVPNALGSQAASVQSDHTSHGPETRVTGCVYLSTAPDAPSIRDLIETPFDHLTLLIGPEGGWADQELAMFTTCNLTGVKLTTTILRIETAAITAAAIAATLLIRV